MTASTEPVHDDGDAADAAVSDSALRAMIDPWIASDLQGIYEGRVQELMLGRLTDFMFGADAEFNQLARQMAAELGIDPRLAGNRLYAKYRSVLHKFQGVGPSVATRRAFALAHASELLAPKPQPAYLIDGLLEQNVTCGLVGPPESGKSLLGLHIAACIASGRPFFGRNVIQGLCVYLAGEGFHGFSRRAQAIALHHRFELDRAPLVVSRSSASLLDSAELEQVRAAITEAERRYGEMRLLVVDTLARFVAPGNESDTADMSAFLSAVDKIRGSATSIVCHHPGHNDAQRGRGSSAWRAGVDAEFILASHDNVITLSASKMKDGERPQPLSFRIVPAPTKLCREDASPINSVVLELSDIAPTKPKPTGKNQTRLLAELEKTPDANWTDADLRAIARGLGMHKSSARDAVVGLRNLGYLVGGIAGSQLASLNGTNGTKRDESTISARTVGDEKDDDSLESSLSAPSRSTNQPCPRCDGEGCSWCSPNEQTEARES